MILSMKKEAQRSLRALQQTAAALSAVALIVTLALNPGASLAAEKKEISHTIGKEMQAAQKALQAGQWAEALKSLDEAEGKSGITAFDKFKIHDLKGYAEFKLSKYKEAETDYEAALAAGENNPEEKAGKNKT